MCGRYLFTLSPEELTELFGVPEIPFELRPRYNIAPTQPAPVVGLKADGVTRGLVLFQWGIVPAWGDPKKGAKLFNAKAETVANLTSFRDSFARRRCIVPASGYYEWSKHGTKKVGHHFRRADGRPMGFAGIWDRWGTGPDLVRSFAVITTEPNDLGRPIHNRMPAILHPSDYGRWLDPHAAADDLLALLAPFPAQLLAESPVGPAVNSARNDGPECVAPAAVLA